MQRIEFAREAHRCPLHIAVCLVVLLGSVSALSAHVVRGVLFPTQAMAFVSSPSGNTDTPIRLMWADLDTGIRLICFNVANTSPRRPDAPAWPRINAIGFELPGEPTGFSLLAPTNREWTLVEQQQAAIPGRGTVMLDFALVTGANPMGLTTNGPLNPPGLPPGQPATRGSGTRFCVSGPFPDMLPNPAAPAESVPTTIESLINGVVVGFDRVEGHGPSGDVGHWDNPLRVIPLYEPLP